MLRFRFTEFYEELILLLWRWLIFFGAVARYFINFQFEQYDLKELYAVVASLIFFFVYSIYVSVITLNSFEKKTSNSNLTKYTVVIVDIILFSVLYFLTKRAESDFFLFYFLPLYDSVRIFPRSDLVIVTTSIILTIIGVVVRLLSEMNADDVNQAFMRITLPRGVFFVFVVIFFSVTMRQLRVKTTKLEEATNNLRRLREIDTRISYQIDTQSVLETILGECKILLGTVGGHIRLREGNTLRRIAGDGPELVRDEDADVTALSEHVPSFVKAFQTHKTVIVQDANDDYHFRYYVQNSHPIGIDVQEVMQIKGFGCFPLIVGHSDEVIGVLTIRAHRVGFFTQDIIDLLEQISLRAAIEIKKAQLLEDRQREANKYRDFARSVYDIAKAPGRSSRLDRIVREAVSSLKGKGAKIFLLSDDRSHIELAAIEGFDDSSPTPGNYRIAVNQGLVGQVIKHNQPRIDHNYGNSTYALNEFKDKIETIIEIPMTINEDTVIGALAVVADRSQRVPFDYEHDVPDLKRLADQAAISVYGDLIMRREETLRDFTKEIISLRETKEIAQRTVSHFKDMFSADGCSFQLLYNDMLYIIEYLGNRKDIVGEKFAVSDNRGNQRVVLTKMYHIVSDVSTSKEFQEMHITKGMEDIEYWLGVPLLSHGQVLGMITIDRTKSGQPWITSDAELAQTYANFIAIALHNARLIEQTQVLLSSVKGIYSVG